MLQLRAAGARWQRALPNLWSTLCRGQENAHQKPTRQPRLRQPVVGRPADGFGDAEELKIEDWQITDWQIPLNHLTEPRAYNKE